MTPLGGRGSLCNVIVRCFCSVASSQPTKRLQLHLRSVRDLCSCGLLHDAFTLFYALDAPFDPPTHIALFHACARYGQLHLGQTLHHQMLTSCPDATTDLLLNNHLINMYAKCGQLEYAHQLFDQMSQKNIVSWTSLISGYSQHGHPNECFSLFSDMIVHFLPTEFAFASVLSSCHYEQGRQVHALALKTCFDAYVYVANALITMYSKKLEGCYFKGVHATICFSDRDEAWAIFGSMRCRNIISWNSMIAAFQSNGLWPQTITLFSQMHKDGIGYDRATLLSTISSLCGNSDDIYVGFKFQYCIQLHGLTIRTGLSLEIEVLTALIKAYSSLGGDAHDCYKLFMDSNGRQDIVSWTGIITTYSEQYPQEALVLFRQLIREGWAPDRYTLSSVLKACAGLMTERHASAVHAHVIRAGFEPDTVLSNVLVHSYARCGAMALSKQVFDDMVTRDTVSWNSMLKAYALHGQAREALMLFSKMDVHPDAATFVALLSACSHAGMLEAGSKTFDDMFAKYDVVPELDHYACMVDLFGRSGRLTEAEELVRRMPMEPDSVVWSSLLGACMKHKEIHLAELAAAKLRQLDPGNSLGYVLMSNIHRSDGSYNEARILWKEMKGSGVRKRPGLSWIELEGQVHEFASGGLRHPQIQEICIELETLIGKLKDLGYVPETSLSLHDVEEEQKAEQLYYHSEKLALVFALMSSGRFCGGWAVIKIMKNIRICQDCHNFMKFASRLVEREIIVRDSNRFHHFKGGICSCSDYW